MAGHETPRQSFENGSGGNDWDSLNSNFGTLNGENNTGNSFEAADEESADVEFEDAEQDLSEEELGAESAVPEEGASADETKEEESANSEENEAEANHEKLKEQVEGIVQNIGRYRPADILHAAKAAGVSLPSYRLNKLREYGMSDPNGSGLMDLMRIAANFSEDDTKAMNERESKKHSGEGEGEGETQTEAETETNAEGEGETVNEGEAEAEGEAESSAEGEAEANAEGEAETNAEGEAEANAEGEAETNAEGEASAGGNAEGEASVGGNAEGEAATDAEANAEGEASAGGNAEGEGVADDTDAEGDADADAEGEGVADDTDAEGDAEGDSEDKESKENKESKKGKFGKKSLIALALAGITFVSALFGGLGYAAKNNKDARAQRAQINPKPGYTDSMQGTTTADLTDNDIVTMATEAARNNQESNHEGFSHEDGNWSIGLFADENGENSNPEKTGQLNIAPPTVLEKFKAEGALDTEEGQKEFKDTLSESWKNQAGSIAMVARALKAQGDDALLPDSLKGMSGEQMERAIVSNENGAYDDMCGVLDKIMDNSTVEATTLNGNYHNFYMTEYDISKPATKDNIDLVACEKVENGSDAYVISGNVDDVDVQMIVKGECTQIVYVTRIPEIIYVVPPEEDTPTYTTTTTSSTPETTTTTTTSSTPETTTTTTSSTPETTTTTTSSTPETTTTTTSTTPETTTTTTSTTPETTTTTTTQDVSKHEDALREGQGGNVTPVQEGTRVTENMSQVDQDGTTHTEAVNPAAQQANDEHAGDVNRTQQDQALQQQREQNRQEQQTIDAQRSTEAADLPPINDLSNGF